MVAVSGSCQSWLASTVSGAELSSAIELQGRENRGCDPNLYNAGGSGACGVAQELPCGKSGCGIPPNADGACQIRWMNSYVIGRYGSWAAALQHHNAFNWY